MLKKILILALTLNTPYILPSHSSPTPGQDFALSCAALVSGIMCAWLAYKGFKKGWQANKEVQHHLKMLNEMGIKVHIVQKSEIESSFLSNSVSVMQKEHYTMKIPSNFSKEQQEKAKEHWSLFLANDKKVVNINGCFGC